MTKEEFNNAIIAVKTQEDVEIAKQDYYIRCIKGAIYARYDFYDSTSAYIQNTFLLLDLFDKLLISDEEYDLLITYNIDVNHYIIKKEGEERERSKRRCNAHCRSNTQRNASGRSTKDF